jgi:hypothetical protein
MKKTLFTLLILFCGITCFAQTQMVDRRDLAGYVFESNGTPIPNAQITANPFLPCLGLITVNSDVNGFYVITNLPFNCSYTVQATKMGFSFSSVFIDSGVELEQTDFIDGL